MEAISKKTEHGMQDYFVKLRIDERTIIFVRSLTSLKSWLAKFPNAVKVL